MNLNEVLNHPITALAVVLSAVGQFSIGWIEPVWSLVSATSGMWFPAIAVTAGTIMPEIGLEGIGTPLLVGAAILFVGVQLDRLADRVAEHLNK